MTTNVQGILADAYCSDRLDASLLAQAKRVLEESRANDSLRRRLRATNFGHVFDRLTLRCECGLEQVAFHAVAPYERSIHDICPKAGG